MSHSNSIQNVSLALKSDQHAPSLAVFLVWVAGRITVWTHRARSRKLLTHLTDRELDDIGVTRADAEREALKKFWMQ